MRYHEDMTTRMIAPQNEQPRGQIFKETEQGLVINKNIEFKMISIGRDEEGLSTTIKNATRKETRHPEIAMEDGFKRFK